MVPTKIRPLGSRRLGFTLIELLVVIAVIAVLVALLLPAVQAARASSFRLKCSNNLKQIGVALANYTTVHGGLPPGYTSTWNPATGIEQGPGWGWGSMILPYVEQQQLYDQIRFNVNIENPVNLTTRTTPLNVYLCPSDNMPRVWTATNGEYWIALRRLYSAQYPICDVAGANYVGMFGIGEPGVEGDGVFYRDSFVHPQDIRDGTSSTLAVGERSVTINSAFVGTAIQVGAPLESNGRGQATWAGAVAGAVLWSCAPIPNDPDSGSCIREDGSGMTLGHTGEGHGPGDPHADVNQFLSQHGRGSHFLYCDGHVQFLQNTINYQVYKALSTRATGEVISDGY